MLLLLSITTVSSFAHRHDCLVFASVLDLKQSTDNTTYSEKEEEKYDQSHHSITPSCLESIRLPYGFPAAPTAPSRVAYPSPGTRPVRALRSWPAVPSCYRAGAAGMVSAVRGEKCVYNAYPLVGVFPLAEPAAMRSAAEHMFKHMLTEEQTPCQGVHVAAEKASILRVKVPSCQLPDSGT
jgi:hypothetical protein